MKNHTSFVIERKPFLLEELYRARLLSNGSLGCICQPNDTHYMSTWLSLAQHSKVVKRKMQKIASIFFSSDRGTKIPPEVRRNKLAGHLCGNGLLGLTQGRLQYSWQ